MFTCVFSHVFHFVELINDFFTDEGFKDVFERDRPLSATEFIGYQREVLFRFNEVGIL